MSVCAYCNQRRAVQTDHVITKNQARRSVKAAELREHLQFKVPACRECNEAKGTRLLVPPSHADCVEPLEALTHGTYRVWDGKPELLRTVG
jgi:5-methylcytosine-specific restriction endonuclease McrA